MSVSRETRAILQDYVSLLLAENERQNLISRSSAEHLWTRHIEDSLQLLDHAPAEARWLDIGSGAGLPGMVLAIAGVRSITLVEPRRLRTDFLERSRVSLGLTNVTVVIGKVEQLTGAFDIITARAVAPLTRLFDLAGPLMAPGGRWVLPKGRSAEKELEEARSTWQGDFRLVPSRTDPDAQILVAEGVRRRMGRG
nr:16S rRNA (guanine(527)-N(7))-methyltransferase RsmG [uncultured Sphingomonas sp.]